MKKISLLFSLVLVSSIIFSATNHSALASDLYDEEDSGAVGTILNLYIGEAKILPVKNPTRIAVGNPSIADVTEAKKTELTIAPKASGATTLIIWDDSGELSYRLRVFTERIEDIQRRVDNLLERLNLPQVYTEVAEEEEKVLILGRVKTAEDKERIGTVLGALREKTLDLVQVKEEEAVVEIDVQVLELDEGATRTLGFQWPGSISIAELGSAGISETGSKWSNLFNVLNLQRAAFNWTLDALIQENKAKILSRPRLACQSGKEAELLVGGEKPILTTSVAEGGETTEVEYKEFGIKLNIRPEVTAEREIKLALDIEVSEVGATAETLGSASAPEALAYPLTKRTVSSELFLDDGQTLIIGGLMKKKTEQEVRKTAGLSELPIIGLFFRNKETKTGGGAAERGDTELFIMLTPTIIKGKIVPLLPGQKKPAEEDKLSFLDLEDESLFDTTPGPLERYAVLIQKRILENLTYPPAARDASFEGSLKLSLLLSYRGEVLDVKVKESSGYRVLDDSAVSLARETSPYPPFPSSLNMEELWIDIPITYQLD
ncbi:MAG: TonB family protein [Candidatus Omnitrophota bacterium]